MHTEYECTILEIDKEKFERRLMELGFSKIGEYSQRRYTYQYQKGVRGKWLRLRTNGEKTTLTIKNITDRTLIGGTRELEVEVSSFDDTKYILEELGLEYNNYQENKRIDYVLGDICVSIDSWPLIPTYAEIEGKSEEEVRRMVELIDMEYRITNLDVTSIYEDIYGINILDMKELKFDLGEE